ncbi:DUF2497 domain-containing protein [Nitratireductor sp. GISD-1A_MAKvit]|uniref:PopZ family protein n=1 Tax=Nitratireductor sp. GISD-1A_MAKvit TaxID=3234198 RepID=UPI003466B36D
MEAAVEALTSNGNQREPSMEEILASIRRIIEDNDAPSQRSAETARASETGQPRGTQAAQDANPSQEQSWPPDGEQRGGDTRSSDETAARHSGDVESFRAELREAPERPVLQNGAGEPASSERFDTSDGGAAPIDRNLVQRLAEVQAAQSRLEQPHASGHQVAGQNDAAQPERQGSDTAASEDAARQSIVSDYAGRKVAAAFGELNEAFEANRRRNLGQVAEEMLRPMLQDWLDDNLPTIVERLVREEIERIARGG